MEIKNIVFDLGNVIVDVDHRRFTEAMGWPPEKYYQFFRSPYFREFETGKIDENAFFQKLSEYIPLSSGDVQRYRDLIHRAFPLRAKTWGIIHWLRPRYRLFLFSNTNSLDFNAINAFIDLTAPFENVYVSYEQGFLKPSKEAYEHAEALFHIRPPETYFFDDREENIRAARFAGWHAVQIENEDGLLHALAKPGIINVNMFL
ncbi:MAG: HAD family phosphatase [Candidatus Marinimicrobia bacterium]|nr:HAD family phosphatase [Candidatus Neomarinimicrobiota bacterium]